jgi:hypothetical protein
MSGQTGSKREQCKVAVFLIARKLSDPDPNVPVALSPPTRLILTNAHPLALGLADARKF